MRRIVFRGCAIFLLPFLFASCGKKVKISGELKKWHCVTLTFTGPKADENGSVNPFLDYRLEVDFTHAAGSIRVPGFFAADGNAAETGATSGNRWRVRFTPNQPGLWEYRVSFRKGKNAAVSDSLDAGGALGFDGASGSFLIGETDKKAPDFRARGMLRYVWKHYLRFGETQDYFIKAGADSPENFLGYADFDGTPPTHRYEPHLGDWNAGDPTWRGEKGKGIIGMKILGQGDLRNVADNCLQWVLAQDVLDCFTIGAESIAEMKDLLTKIPAASVRA